MVNPSNKSSKYRKQLRREILITKNLKSTRKKRRLLAYNKSASPNRNFSITNENTHIQVPDLTKDIDIDYSVKKAIQMLIRTKIDNSNDEQCSPLHSANICVVCDTFIIGVEPVEWISKEHLLKHKKSLSVENYELFFKRKLANVLIE